jgi:hypothetical protein
MHNPSLEPTRTGMALGPLPGVVHHPSSVPSVILTAVGDRNAGERFVCHVLAVHAAKKVTALRRPLLTSAVTHATNLSDRSQSHADRA